MKQIYKPYWVWECYKSGMWNKISNKDEVKFIEIATNFMSDHLIYGKAMKEVVYLWENTMINHLTNKFINRRAFLGQCAVFYKKQVPETLTRIAWRKLTDRQRNLADYMAEKTIKEWELWLKIKLNNTFMSGKKDAIKMGYQMKLPLS
jgi:hypothetical protein